MKRKKKSKLRIFIFLIFLIFLSVYGGFKGGEYMANKLAKPVPEEAKGGNKAGQAGALSENEMVVVTAAAMEFITAEHTKEDDKLASVIDKDYYGTFLKSMKQISKGEVTIQDINYKSTDKDKAEIEVVFLKNNKKESELITLKKSNGVWKVTKVDR